MVHSELALAVEHRRSTIGREVAHLPHLDPRCFSLQHIVRLQHTRIIHDPGTGYVSTQFSFRSPPPLQSSVTPIIFGGFVSADHQWDLQH